ncbi:MAG: 16S rRNA (cytidine(1402)-2'-O)-methyltransferase [Polyangiaceae bacterium]|nr:16S rRNA (cytidine(1402)-2'-O)-methyltransferase [Polyangiaceae bacterium]
MTDHTPPSTNCTATTTRPPPTLFHPTLFIVPTPIGNLEDITLRAISTLRNASKILAEDTRRTRKLLSHLHIDSQKLERLDANASDHDINRVITWIQQETTEQVSVALTTDAGTPSVSDPGRALVSRAHQAGIQVVALPGASAVTTAVAASGLVDGPFSFMGFAPRRPGELTNLVNTLAQRPEPCVIFESPNRLQKTLVAIADAMPERQITVARELSKLHEELVRGPVREVAAIDREWIGEITLVLGPWDTQPAAITDDELDSRIDRELESAVHKKTVAGIVAAWSGRNRRDVYARVIERSERRKQ